MLSALLSAPTVAAEPDDEIGALIRALNDDHYNARQEAADRLEQLAADPNCQKALARAVKRRLLEANTTFEVRSRLERLAARLPRVDLEPSAEVSPQELEALLDQLDGATHADRLGAAVRLEWLSGRPEVATELIARLKRRLADPTIAPDVRKRMQGIWHAARRVWLSSDPRSWRLPPVSPTDIQRWLDDLVRPAGAENPFDAARRQAAAEQELLDLLARDEYLAETKAALQQRLDAGGLDDTAQEPLTRLLEWTKPAMVAEAWREKHHVNIQRLLIGVPQQSQGAERPSHFDRCDDRTAHCVSGNSLSPGDYPVGVLFPNPRLDAAGALFHLVSLPTPRRRMAYEYMIKTDEAVRLAELSERTLNYLLAQHRPLKESELIMLAEIDDAAVSRFAPRYFLAVGDPPPSDRKQQHERGVASPHANLAHLLAEIGTHDAIPELLDVIRQNRLPAPTAESPYAWPWVAALAIAERDPWPDVDEWLAGLIERTDPLRVESPNVLLPNQDKTPPELGATAAGILLRRHAVLPESFGVVDAPDPALADSGVPRSYFLSPEMRAKVIAWWKERQAAE